MDFSSFLPYFGSPVLTILAFVVALSIIVAVHEYGHYIVGRWSGIAAEVFSIGFGPIVWSRVDKRGTRWQIAAFPLGGYVKFLGDANAASVGGDDTTPKARNTMLGAPLWARAATVAAGPVFNFIFSAAVFAALLAATGLARSPLAIDTVPPWPSDRAMELQAGDEVLGVGGLDLDFDDPAAFGEAIAAMPSVENLVWQVRRDGVEIEVQGPHPTPAFVQSVTPRSAADDAGLRIGDVILTMNDQPVFAFGDMITVVEGVGEAPVALQVWRDGAVIEKTMTPRLTPTEQADGSLRDEYKLGIGHGGLFFAPQTRDVGLFEAIWLGIDRVWYIITQSIKGLASMVSGAINTCALSGPVGIAEAAGSLASQGLTSFITFVAVLSTAVGLLNLFPIPILDGGHLVFHAWEAVTGKPPSDGALRILMAAGLALIGTLMLFAIGNDLFFCP